MCVWRRVVVEGVGGGAENVEPGWAKCFTYVVLLNQ